MAKTVKIKESTWKSVSHTLDTLSVQKTVNPLTRRQSTIVKVRNDSGVDVPQFGVLGIANSVFDPITDATSFRQQIVLSGVKPEIGLDDNGRFVICCEPVAMGQIGDAVIAGASPVQVMVGDETHLYADIDNAQTGYLKSAEMGPCLMVWRQSGTGLKWAIVKFGGVGGTATSEAMCEIRRSLLWPDAARDPLNEPPEGYSQYVVAIDEVALWGINQLIEVGDLRRNADGIVFMALIAHMIQEGAHDEPTLEEPTEYWRLYCPLPPCQEGLALDAESIDYRDYAAWFNVGDIVPLRRQVNALTGKTTYVFGVRMMRTREHGMTIQSLLYDPDERRSKVVFGDAETEFEGT